MSISTTAFKNGSGAFNAVDATDGNVTITVGPPDQVPNTTIVVAKIDLSPNTVEVQQAVNAPLAMLLEQGDQVTLYSTGTTWEVSGLRPEPNFGGFLPCQVALGDVQADTVAADLPAMKADFNTLLAFLRTELAALKSTGWVN